jgi:hypothetical protein
MCFGIVSDIMRLGFLSFFSSKRNCLLFNWFGFAGLSFSYSLYNSTQTVEVRRYEYHDPLLEIFWKPANFWVHWLSGSCRRFPRINENELENTTTHCLFFQVEREFDFSRTSKVESQAFPAYTSATCASQVRFLIGTLQFSSNFVRMYRDEVIMVYGNY